MWSSSCSISLLALLSILVLVNSQAPANSIPNVSVFYDEKLDTIYYNGKVFVNKANVVSYNTGLEIKEIPRFAEELPQPEYVGKEESKYPPGSTLFYYSLIISVLLTLGAGVMSGLTVGYLSIDQLELEMKLQNGTETEKKHALAVLPVLEDHHYLLVTLLLANALCMEALPIYLDTIVPSAYAILISVVAVLFFGEVIPQAICTGPQQIRIGAFLAPLIQLLKIVLGIVAYPIAKILDCILGEHITTRYSNNDLKALIELHSYHALEAIDKAKDWRAEKSGLKPYQTKMIKSVIEFKDGTVQKLMVPHSQIFSLRVDQNIDNNVAKKITKAGFSRIPVYEKQDKNRIIGILLIKTLIGLDLKNGRKISDLVNEGEVTLRKPFFISPNEKFEGLFEQFMQGKSHMAIVTDDPDKMDKYLEGLEDVAGEVSLLEKVPNSDNEHKERHKREPASVLGVLTLEDLIEHIIKEDILDEADYDNDLAKNKDPNVRRKIDKSWANDPNNLSQLFIENRDKIHDYLKTQVKERMEDKKKYHFRKEYAQSITLRNNELSDPLLENKNKDDYDGLINNEENKEQKA